MSTARIILLVYGLLMFGGGYMGYAKAGSKMSLIMGVVSGIIIFAGLYLAGSKPALGFGIIGGISGLLAVTFIIRLIKTNSFMPAGMLLILSLAACALSLCQWKKCSAVGSSPETKMSSQNQKS